MTPPSTADAELVDDDPVSLRSPDPEVLQKAAPLADQHEQPAPRMMILRVLLEVVGQAVDALGQERDLHLGRTGVAVVGAELLDQTFLLVDSKRHGSLLQSPRPREPSLPRQGGFQNPLFCPQIRRKPTTRSYRSKDNGRVTKPDALL